MSDTQAWTAEHFAEPGHAPAPIASELLKDAELLIVPTAAAAVAAVMMAAHNHAEHQAEAAHEMAPAPEPAPPPIEQAPTWPEHPQLLPAAPDHPPMPPPPADVDPLILELEQAGHAAPLVHAGYEAPAVPPPQVPQTDPFILELEQNAHSPAPAPLPETYAPAPQPAAPQLVAMPVAPPPEPMPVAQAEKPVEIDPKPADHAAVMASAAPEPSVAPIAALAAPALAAFVATHPMRPTMNDTPTANAESVIDPVLAGFDHVVALAGYVLLFISVFMAGVPALATLALAYAHNRDSHPIARSHFRFQLRIFWTAILFLALCLGSAVAAGGLAVAKLIQFAQDHLPGLSGVMAQANVSAWSGQIAGLMVIAAVMFFVLAVVWTLGSSAFGFLRLLANRPIGHPKPSA